MAPRTPPASLGTALADILTPALLCSMPTLEANEARMRTLLRGTGVALRPHAKLHKSEAFAKWHMEASADEPIKGFCAQTVRETASCLRAGSKDVLLTNSLPRHGAMSRWHASTSPHNPMPPGPAMPAAARRHDTLACHLFYPLCHLALP